MKTKWIGVLLLVISGVFVGCGENNEDIDKNKSIEFAPEQQLEQTVYADETHGQAITFTTKGSWTSSIKERTVKAAGNSQQADWIHITPDHGAAAEKYTIVFTIDTNNTGHDREAEVEIASGDDKISIFVKQLGTPLDPNNGGEGKGVVINGVRWATCNVDRPSTFTAHPEDAGMFYQWNRKIGWSSTDPIVNSNGGTTWDNSDAAGDKWEKANDPCPAGWRVPTHEEQNSLDDTRKVRYEWIEINGKIGVKFTDNSTGNSIFLPAAGYRSDSLGALYGRGDNGNYWSSTQNSSSNAYFLNFDSPYVNATISYNRALGFSVRCLKE